MSDIKLSQWFDLSKKIDKDSLDIAISQMMLYAIKDEMDPNCAGARAQYRKMRLAVKLHNASITK